MKSAQGFRLAIEWGNEYKEPPDGRPRVLAEVYVITDGGAPKIPASFIGLAPLGSGYSYTIRHVGEPTKPITQEARASVRRKRLERRVKQKYPLLADQFIEDEMQKKSDFYSGITDPNLQAGYDSAIEWEQREYEKLIKTGITVEELNV